MKLRNNRFAAALDYLKRNTDIKTQKELARRMGVTETTITRILKDYTEVTEDIITKLQTATGCIFNLQWLRGEDSEHMLAEDVHEVICPQPSVIGQPSLVNSLYEQIIKEKDARIALLETMLKTYQQRIAELENQSDCLPTGLKIG
jgi:transcriptional regulator with XRE-family HTH domain